MKKLIGLLFVSLLVLFGCSKSGSEEMVTITWYFMGDPPADEVLVEDTINEYLVNDLGRNYQVDTIYFGYGEYTDKMNMKIQSGEEMDIIFTPNWALDYVGNAQDGLYVDLTPYLENEMAATYEAVNPLFWEGVTVDGGIYGVPTNKEMGIQKYIVFDAAKVEEYGIDVSTIKTWEDLVAVLREVHAIDPTVKPLLADVNTHWAGMMQLDCLPGTSDQICLDPNNPDAGYMFVYDIPGYKEMMENINSYIEEGLIALNTLELWDMATEDWFCIIQDGFPYAESSWEASWGKDVIAVPLAAPLVTTTSTQGSVNAISATSQHVEECVDFLNLVNTDPFIRNTLAYGVEGVHYTLNEQNQVVYTDQQPNYAPGVYEQGNFYELYTVEGEPVDKWDQFAANNETAIMSPALGFTFDTSEVESEMANFASLVEGKYMTTLVLGQCADFDAELAAFYADTEAFLQPLLDEINRQYFEWKEAQ